MSEFADGRFTFSADAGVRLSADQKNIEFARTARITPIIAYQRTYLKLVPLLLQSRRWRLTYLKREFKSGPERPCNLSVYASAIKRHCAPCIWLAEKTRLHRLSRKKS